MLNKRRKRRKIWHNLKRPKTSKKSLGMTCSKQETNWNDLRKPITIKKQPEKTQNIL